jgi:hypothetical protein
MNLNHHTAIFENIEKGRTENDPLDGSKYPTWRPKMAKKNETAPATAATVEVELTPKQAKKKERKAARKARKAEVRARVLKFVEANSKELGTLADDLKFLCGRGGRRVVGLQASINTAIRTAFAEKGSLSEMDIFKMFKIGRPEMVGKIRRMILTANPADRLWVKFDEKTEIYTVIAKGPTPPDGWTGYVPSEKDEL